MSDSLPPGLVKAASLVRDVPDFPSPGILFKDITPVLSDAEALKAVVDAMTAAATPFQPELIVGIESRGFLFGVPMALQMGLGFSPVRKKGKLPYDTLEEEYALEYGTNVVEAHIDAVKPDQRVVIVDDLLATGGTAVAAANLIERLGGVVVGYCFLVELEFLKGRDRLKGRDVSALIRY